MLEAILSCGDGFKDFDLYLSNRCLTELNSFFFLLFDHIHILESRTKIVNKFV
jgi:hypothetical protein